MEQRNRRRKSAQYYERKRAIAYIRRRLILYGIVAAVILLALILILSGGDDKTQTPEQDMQTAQSGSDVGESQTPTLSDDWQVLTMTQSDMAQGHLILVNADYAYDPNQAEDLVAVYSEKNDYYYVSTVELLVSRTIMSSLNNWMEDFYQETGIDNIELVAGHRTVEYQQYLRDRAVENHGQEHADNYIALPGHSEHHTGFAIDLDTYYAETDSLGGFDGTGDYAWVVENAWRYGFVQRYPSNKQDVTGISYEEWHFRHVGLPHSKIMYDNNLCLEEYIAYLRNYPFDGNHLTVEVEDDSYEIYYCQGLTVTVPKDREYEISGNNVDGFIVTIRN